MTPSRILSVPALALGLGHLVVSMWLPVSDIAASHTTWRGRRGEHLPAQLSQPSKPLSGPPSRLPVPSARRGHLPVEDSQRSPPLFLGTQRGCRSQPPLQLDVAT